MDSDEDDMYDSNDIESSDDDGCIDDTDQPHQKGFTIMKDEDVRSRQEEDIKTICDVLSVPRSSSIFLLLHYHWSVDVVQSEWFSDEGKVRKAVGLFDKKQPIADHQITKIPKLVCGICFDHYHQEEMYDASGGCGHLFCESCWKGYVGTSVNDGPGCLMLRCPDPPCNAAVCQDMVHKLVSHEGKKKYSNYLLRSYIEGNKSIKWCPGAGCDSAIQIALDSENYDVTCECTYSFCWNCVEEPHHPVECSTVEKWNIKNTSEGENVTWILAHSKPCPNCKRPIEKNQGCNSMFCSMCKCHFCWACLEPYAKHYACNGYAKNANTDMGKRREMAKQSIEKYTHYYERWAGNNLSRAKAVEDLQKLQSLHIEKLSSTQCETQTKLQFITDAWIQIIECRRFLKWTYAYGYYLPEHEKAKKDFFEYLQGEAEHYLERLHECAEKELQPHLDAERQSQDFNDFRMKLTGLTSVTKNYFENLARGLANGLSNVDCERDARARAIEEYKTEGRKYRFYKSDDEA